jgi:2-phospho-L-lactate transferase/gluconeogenesis factor (CofD/UPF0052 family)
MLAPIASAADVLSPAALYQAMTHVLCTIALSASAAAFGQAAGCRICDVMMQQQDVAAQLQQQQQQQQLHSSRRSSSNQQEQQQQQQQQ